MTTPSNDEVWALFHRMWGDSKAQRSYVKADWLALQAMLQDRLKPVEANERRHAAYIGGTRCGVTSREIAHPGDGQEITCQQCLELMDRDFTPEPTETAYNKDGHVCGVTNRKAMTVAQVLELMKDDPDSVHSFEYDQESAGLGLDPWRLVDSINQCTKEPKAELWFDNGGSMIVELDSILYVQQPKAKK